VNAKQFDKLAELSLDIAKAMYITAFAISAFSPGITIIRSVQSFVIGTTFTLFSLYFTREYPKT